ncbi:MAG: hypothetical protein IJ563_06685 [Selenomonadaceae bacterium]|nr:hypothetical protein [Selenomonadaceae bacterium]MBR1860024.1 hypothetical protein [Selenomonadaceae bacterium]
MFKKIFVVALVTFAIIFVNEQNKVSAYDVYCVNYSDGAEVYLMSETVHQGQLNEEESYLDCRVKAIKSGRVIYYVDYRFEYGGGSVTFKNSHGENGAWGGIRLVNSYPLETKIFEIASHY